MEINQVNNNAGNVNNPPRKPLPRTRKQLEKILLDMMKGILGSCVTTKALDRPSEMTFDDIHLNFHLCERLCNAHGCVVALKGYGKPDSEFTLVEDGK